MAGIGETPILHINGVLKEDAERKRQKQRDHKEITLRQYLDLVAGDPLIAQNSPARIWEIIYDAGVEAIPEQERWLNVDKEYLLFARELFGIDESTAQAVNQLRVGESKGSTGQQILNLVGPPASGKSTWVKILMRALEAYRKRPTFVIKGCPKWEEPLHLLPRYLRDEVAKRLEDCRECAHDPGMKHLHLGVKIEGDLCSVCRNLLETTYRDPDGAIRWWDVLVETFTFSVQGRRGIGSFEPSDEKSSDVTALSGRENVGVTSNPNRGYKDPHAYELSGEIPAGERGIVEGREILSCDPGVLRIFFSVAQEKELKVEGSNFPHLSVDTVVIGHTNLTVFKEFSANKKYEGLHDRFFIVPFPYPLRIKDEVKLYRKLIERESDFVHLKKCHIAPGVLELAATFAVMTRYATSAMGVDLLTKAKVYNGDKALTELQDKEKNPIDLRHLQEEGRPSSDIGKWEGMFGVSSRTVLAALNTALVEVADKTDSCLTPLAAIRSLREVFSHRMGFAPEDIERFKLLLSAGEGNNVMSEYKNLVIQMVTKAYLYSYQDLARELFLRWVREAELYRTQTRKLVRGQTLHVERDLEGRPKDPDVKFLRSVEMHIPWTDQEAEVGRGEVLEYKATHPDFSFETYPPLARACERKLMADSTATLTLVLAADRPKTEEERRRADDLFTSLTSPEKPLEERCCKICAQEAVEKAREFLRE